MKNHLYESSPEQKIIPRCRIDYSLENTVNKAFRQSWNMWVSVEEDHDIVKPFRRFTGGKVNRDDATLLKEFFNDYADGLIKHKKQAIAFVEEHFTHDFDKNHLIADPKAFNTMLQEAIDQIEIDRGIVNKILSLH